MRAAAIALCLVSAMTADCWACTCSGPPSSAVALQSASAVFVGTVLSAKSERPKVKHPLGGYRKHRIRIEQSWKGAPAGKVVTVYTTTGICGTGYQKGEVVVIYADRDKYEPHQGMLYTSLCSRSGLNVVAESDSLGPPSTVRGQGSWWPWK